MKQIMNNKMQISYAIMLVGILLLFVITVGCTGKETVKPIGGDKDEHGCLIAAGYTWCEAKQKCLRSWEEECKAEAPLVGGDKDEHGCIGSAGYTWCEAKQKCLRSWEEECTSTDIKDSEIDSFQDCVDAGYPVMLSYPAQCMTKDGRSFTEEVDTPVEPPIVVPQPDMLCEDNCGDGRCDEIVCLATGCPCAETKQDCPEDCIDE